MTNKDFTKIIEDELEYVKSLLISKGEEYAVDTDRLSAFKKGAELMRTTPEVTLLGYLTKHIVSIYDMAMSDSLYTKEKWTEKITDFINYGLLLLALANEKGFKNE